MIHRPQPRRVRPTLLALALAAAIAGCDHRDTAPEPSPAPVPVAAILVGTPKALFRWSPQRASDAALHELDADGGIHAVEFVDADEVPVRVKVTELRTLSRDWVWLRLFVVPRPAEGDPDPVLRTVLLRVTDGRLFDAEGLSLGHAQLKGQSLYAHLADRPELVRVDLATMTRSPVNDPASDPVGDLPFLVDQQGNVRISLLRNGSSWVTKIFFADGSPPIVDPWRTAGMGMDLCDGGISEYATAYGDDGHLYVVCSSFAPDPEGGASTTRGVLVQRVSFTPSGTQRTAAGPVVREGACSSGCIRLPIGTWTDYYPDSRSRYLLADTTGFFRLTAVPAGGFSLAWTDFPLPAGAWIAGEYAYWGPVDHTISRIRLEAGATAAPIALPIVSTWTVIGGVVVFSGGVGGPGAGTFKVTAPGTEPELISSSVLQVFDFVEL